LFIFFVLGFSDDEIEVKSKKSIKKTTRTTAASFKSEVKNEISDNGYKYNIILCLTEKVYLVYKLYIINHFNVTDSPGVTDSKFGYETPKKMKKLPSMKSSEHITTKTPRTVRKQIAKGFHLIYLYIDKKKK